jgi:hypothetical protein
MDRPWPRRFEMVLVGWVPSVLLLAAAAPPAAASERRDGAPIATAAAPELPRLVLERPGGSVRYGSKATVVATLTVQGKPLAGRDVSLHAASSLVATATTDARGRARFKVRPRQNVRYEAHFVPALPGDATAYQPATSEGLDLVVRPVLRIRYASPLRAGRKAVAIPRERVRLRGRVAPYVPGQRVVIRLTRRERQVRRRTRSVVAAGARGRFRLSLRLSRRGPYTVRASYPRSGTLGAARARTRLVVVRPRARPGSRGIAVRALQRRLSALGYLTPVNGSFGASTARAVLAFRKVNGMARASLAHRAVFKRLIRGGGGYRIRHPRAGKHVEFDWSRQVLVFARGARPVMTLHASSGASSTPTVFGRYRFYSKTPGFNSKRMFYSSYFVGGYAIHGYASVPNYPASHGCIRIPMASAVRAYRWIDLGDPIFVYR